MTTITINKIKEYVLTKSFAWIDIADPAIVYLLTEVTSSLEPSPENLKFMKNLLGGFGIFIMPWMKNIYDAMDIEFMEKYSN